MNRETNNLPCDGDGGEDEDGDAYPTNSSASSSFAATPCPTSTSTSHHHHSHPHQPQTPSSRRSRELLPAQQRRIQHIPPLHPVQAPNGSQLRRKHAPQLYSSGARPGLQLPMFISSVPESFIGGGSSGGIAAPQQRLPTTPTPTTQALMVAPPWTEFATPLHQAARKASRPSSPITASLNNNPPPPLTATTTTIVPIQKPTPFRGRIASIRRESDCSLDAEAAHERLVKCSQQVSMGFEDFCLDEKIFDERKRAKSLTEPISIFTNAFLPQSSSPSPTRAVDTVQQQKQCYSPSTQQVVRNNIPYSPSPSPTPSSPTHNRIMRSMSPIAVRQISKRRYTGSGNTSGLESSDGEGSLSGYPLPAKRHCSSRSAASPLVRDPLAVYPSSSSSSSLGGMANHGGGGGGSSSSNSNVTAPAATSTISGAGLEEPLLSQSFNDNSSTTFSSRAGTPLTQLMEEEEEGILMEEEDISSSSLLPNASLSSADSSSSIAPPPREP